MSKRLQVMLEDEEYAEIENLARRQGTTVAQWVRSALRDARAKQHHQIKARKLAAVRQALTYEFPSGDIDEVLGETQRGYLA
ncbi:ribbon-helix-helix protein, CopG family [Gordonia sp. LSe1-13]|uniref:Ribbon-helix-helix protein, CopG family n=1 Tax=Gordonia sesuvii TaxID=3116777 RepID=A0ABU7MFD7_9ACTN|nr:ribbon-helix-helix protein, CopG family [Gordonia sp. LSe1-13]